jgi:hypothetical protein
VGSSALPMRCSRKGARVLYSALPFLGRGASTNNIMHARCMPLLAAVVIVQGQKLANRLIITTQSLEQGFSIVSL